MGYTSAKDHASDHYKEPRQFQVVKLAPQANPAHAAPPCQPRKDHSNRKE